LLSSDDIAVQILQTWKVSADMFSDADIKGPAPILFAEQPEEVRDLLEADSDKFVKELDRLYRFKNIHSVYIA
jgi:hypothetical protein